MNNNNDVTALIEEALPVFIPYAMERRQAMRGGRFVHYTTAESGLKIIKSEELWLRDVRCMNDYTEVRHGYHLLHKWFGEPKNREIFDSTLNVFGGDIAQEALRLFDEWFAKIPTGTFIFSLSEHDVEKENKFGRLSMWRAYGRNSPALALVFKVPLEMRARGLNLFMTPVDYRQSIAMEMDRVLKNIAGRHDLLTKLPREVLVRTTALTLILAAVSLKHPGFREEQEWRIVYAPELFPSNVLKVATETLQGVPQLVYKFPLKDIPSQGVEGIELSSMLDRVIIEPTAYDDAAPITAALSSALASIGIRNAATLIFDSKVPLRV